MGLKKLQLNLKIKKEMQVCFGSSAFCLKYRTNIWERERENHFINIMNELGTHIRVLR